MDTFVFDFFNFILKGKGLLDYTNLFSPNDCKKNEKIIQKYFQQLKRLKNDIAFLH